MSSNGYGLFFDFDDTIESPNSVDSVIPIHAAEREGGYYGVIFSHHIFSNNSKTNRPQKNR